MGRNKPDEGFGAEKGSKLSTGGVSRRKSMPVVVGEGSCGMATVGQEGERDKPTQVYSWYGSAQYALCC